MTLHRSAQGKMVDMNKLAKQNELTLAVGNVRTVSNTEAPEIVPPQVVAPATTKSTKNQQQSTEE